MKNSSLKKAWFILSFFNLLSITVSFGQNKETPNLPIDSLTGKITYSEVIHVDSSAKKLELFSRAREWFAKAYKSANNVIQMEDKENGKIVGKALIQVYHGSKLPVGHMNYTISIYLKDGRYKYEITNFYHTGDGNKTPDYGVCEKMINTTDKTMGISHQKYYNNYLNQMDTNIKALIVNLKAAMITKSTTTKKDEW